MYRCVFFLVHLHVVLLATTRKYVALVVVVEKTLRVTGGKVGASCPNIGKQALRVGEGKPV